MARIPEVVGWISSAWYFLIEILILFIFKSELISRQKKRGETLTSTWMLRWSILSIISCVLFAFMSILKRITMGQVCNITIPSCAFFQLLAMIFFMFYQLSQIYHCFSQNKIKTDRGYPQYIFYILYSFGFFIVILQLIISYDNFQTVTSQCVINWEHTQNHQIILTLWILKKIVYVLWCSLIVFMYFWKLKKFNKLSTDKNKDLINQRISFILNKILFLNICYQILVGINTIITYLGLQFPENLTVFVIEFIVSGLNMLLLAAIMCLVMEHHRTSYIKLLLAMQKYCNCCCFTSIIDNAKPYFPGHDDVRTPSTTKSDGKQNIQFVKNDENSNKPVIGIMGKQMQRKSIETNTMTVTAYPEFVKKNTHISRIQLNDLSEMTRSETTGNTFV